MADGASPNVRADAAKAALELTVNPCDRLWRYPIGHAVVRAALRTPVTPNHVTIGHAVLGISSGVLMSTGRPEMLVAAGLMYEVRSVLDCFDGVLARARGTSSPYGRAMDQTSDGLSYAAMVIGCGVAFARVMGVSRAVALVLVTTAVSAVCTLCWDFYKRRFTSILLEGRDEVDDEYVKVQVEARERGGFARKFSALLAHLQMLFFTPSSLPGLRARVEARQLLPVEGSSHPAAERLRAMVDAHDPALRSTLLKVGFSGGDTAIFIMNVAIVLTRPMEGFLAATAYCVVILAATISASNRLLHAQPMTASSH